MPDGPPPIRRPDDEALRPGEADPIVRFPAARARSPGTPRSPNSVTRSAGRVEAGLDPRLNGIDVETIQMLREFALSAPATAGSVWLVCSRWTPGLPDCVHSYGSAEPGDLEEDEPTPQEQVLGVVNTCLLLGLRLRCALEGVRLSSIEVTSAGDTDLRGLVGLPSLNPGFRRLDVRIALRGEGAIEQLREIAGGVLATSPVLSSLERPVQVSAEVSIDR